jgi:hypothetical protein
MGTLSVFFFELTSSSCVCACAYAKHEHSNTAIAFFMLSPFRFSGFGVSLAVRGGEVHGADHTADEPRVRQWHHSQ